MHQLHTPRGAKKPTSYAAMKKPTQKQIIFYHLFINKRTNNDYMPVYSFMGEVYMEPLNTWGFISHKVGARVWDVYDENRRLIERIKITGKSGARYYAYRIREDATRESIDDPKLLQLYDILFDYYSKVPPSRT